MNFTSTKVSETDRLKSRFRIAAANIVFAILFVDIFFLYKQLAAPSVATIFDDSLEFPLVVHRLAIAHPTGYPLYTLLGKLFSLFNPQNIAYQLNLMSAFFGALSVALLYKVGLQLATHLPLTERPPWTQHLAAIFGALLFGLGPVFISQATIAEVYTLNAFFVAGTLYLTLQRKWLALAFFYGLSLTHHRTMVLLLPAIIGFIIIDQKSEAEANHHPLPAWGALLAALLLPLSLYLYLPLRAQVGSLDGSYQPTWAGFWQHISGGGYGVFLFSNPFNNERTLAFYWQLITQEIGWWGLGLGLLGLGWLALKRRWPAFVLTGLVGLTYLSFNLFYTVTDIAVFFIPIFFLLALWAGLAVGAILGDLWQRKQWLAFGLAPLLFVLLLSQTELQSRANDWAVHDYGQDMISQPLPANATIVGILGEMTLFRYFQETTQTHLSVTTLARDQEADRLATVEQLLVQSPASVVYLTRELPGIGDQWSLSAAGPLIRVNASPITELPPIDVPADIPLTPELSLAGYAISYPPTHQPRPSIRLTVVWQVKAPISEALKVSARLVDSANEEVAAIDKVPVHFAYPPSLWRRGEYITDVYDLQLPADAPADNYTPLFIVYDPADNNAEVGRLTLPPHYVP